MRGAPPEGSQDPQATSQKKRKVKKKEAAHAGRGAGQLEIATLKKGEKKLGRGSLPVLVKKEDLKKVIGKKSLD